jgi:hypothetical protein
VSVGGDLAAGEKAARPSGLRLILALAKFQPDQKTVSQHHRYSVAMEAAPASPLTLALLLGYRILFSQSLM